jgi:AraC family transcriptional regulator of adaptative response/methylated-DNA-[protein]-cysteine methyltransferase
MVRTDRNESASYRRIEKVIRHIDLHHADQPGLDELAEVAGLSVFHFSREFRRWAGLSPTRYLRTVALSVAKRELDERGSVLAAAWAAGLSGGGRLHDLFVNFEAVTPGEYKESGAGMRLTHGFAQSPFGRIHAARRRASCIRGWQRCRSIAGSEAPLAACAIRARRCRDRGAGAEDLQ